MTTSSTRNGSVASHSHYSQGTEHRGLDAAQKKGEKNVCISRSVFILGLLVLGAGISVAAYFILRQAEQSQAQVRLEAISDRALTTSREIVQRKRLGAISMADTVAWIQSNATDWPFVTVDGYEPMANNIIATSKARTLGLCPFVYPKQKLIFEDFAYDFLHVNRKPHPWDNTTAVSSFGKGIWKKTKKSPDVPDGRLPVPSDANNTWGSPNRVFAPILQHSTGDKAPVLLLNVNFEPTRGVMVDDLIQCSRERALMPDPSQVRCGVLTDMLNLASQQEGSGPDAIMMEPIYPAQDPRTLVGFIVSSIVWREALENVFSDDVSGIDCVLRTPKEVFTFGVQEGEAFVKGQGDLHDPLYNNYMADIEIVTQGDFSNTSAVYTFEIYPTSDFFDSHYTNNAIIGLVGALAIILVISGLFYMYDCFVRQEFDHNKELLEAKRRFVRFVSHEVRTPLNTVCMGLTLLQEDIRGHSGRTLLSPHLTETQRLIAKQQEEANLPKSIEVKQEDATEWINLSEEVLGNTQAAVNVLNDLLNYDKIQRGKLSLEFTVIPIWVLVEKTVKEFKLMAAEKEITLKLLFANALVGAPPEKEEAPTTASCLRKDILSQVVVGDVGRISMLLRNLISNALKFTPQKGNLTVQVDATDKLDIHQPRSTSMSFGRGQSRSGSMNNRKQSNADSLKHFDLADGDQIALPPRGYIDIRVIDTGVGMTEAQLKTVFHDGVQFGANKLQGGGGSGLGMFIAKSIVEQHEGALDVTSEGLGHGTTFIAKLPLFYDPPSQQPQADNSEDSIPPPIYVGAQQPAPQEFFPQRILVVDDAAPNRKLLVRLLQKRGHTCDDAEDGQQAVKLVRNARNCPYDTVLLDHEMPVMSGPSACRAMREMGCSSFVAGVTGNLLPEDVQHFKHCGANAVLPKPFKMSSLEQLWIEYGVNGRDPDCNEDDKSAQLGNDSEAQVAVSFNMEHMEA
ncbi:sensor kinase/phosphatase LuxQ [Seminavis robusta]|uniref:histidine kinase n=1 Tax=Seminavis robusta TaxID=568900 RepID=A0A9N8H752_9STRA|nr:sensor kinase/phosphatase LuxQ [Seminavis robusta]|eukprot:Sro60_g034610.1 sensor kinase/phosphatase LuxQ (962) ;mRNA; f:44482-47674